MNRLGGFRLDISEYVPRRRGDEPQALHQPPQLAQRSPQARG